MILTIFINSHIIMYYYLLWFLAPCLESGTLLDILNIQLQQLNIWRIVSWEFPWHVSVVYSEFAVHGCCAEARNEAPYICLVVS